MKRKSTGELQAELMSSASLSRYLSENSESFSSEGAVQLLSRLMEERGVTKAALARDSGMSEVYLYQILSGRRNPSRSSLLCLCLGLNAGLDEAQELLRLSGLAQLYPRIRRDAIVIFGLTHGLTAFDVNDRLFEENEATLF